MRTDSPAAFQLLHGSGAPRSGSGLEPLNGVNDPWRWLSTGFVWVSQPVDVSWGAGATIASFTQPTAGDLAVVIGTRGNNPVDLQASFAGGATAGIHPDGSRFASDPVTLAGSGEGVAFLLWDFFNESQQSGSTYVYDNTDVIPTETRTIEDILGADFTISEPYDWDEEAVGNLGDFYIDVTSPSVDLWGPRLQNTWGGTPTSQLRGSVVEVFTADGTWSKPAGASSVQVSLIAGGGGGDAGTRTDLATTASQGGNGGAGGAWVTMTLPASGLADSVPVTVGAGGTGAPGATANDTTAPPFGTPGEATTFGTYAAAPVFLPTGFPGAPNGGVGGNPDNLAGSAIAPFEGQVLDVVPGATGGAAGTAGGNGGNGAGVPGGTPAPGGSGGGGDYSTTANAGNGGNGGGYGAGGGGGGASANGHVSGAGGNGAPGIAVITTYF